MFSDRISLTVLSFQELILTQCQLMILSVAFSMAGIDLGSCYDMAYLIACSLWPGVHTPAALHNEKQLWRWYSWVGCSAAFISHGKGSRELCKGAFHKKNECWVSADPHLLGQSLLEEEVPLHFPCGKCTHTTTTSTNVLFKINYTL